ncbi:MAG: hypothetical protein IJC35_07200 [Oscillospiraceae bacterium]|nr:hypothetical protein [Oscillospiraceae bacterium]
MKQFENRIIEQYVKVDTAVGLRMRRLIVYVSLISVTMLVFFGILFLSTKFPFFEGSALPLAVMIFLIGLLATRSLTKRRFVEYEYSFVNGQFSVAKIISREKRKEQPGFDVEGASLVTKKYSLNSNNASTFSKVYDYSSSEDSEERWYCIVDRAEGGRCLFIVEPNEKMLAAMKEFTPKHSWQE